MIQLFKKHNLNSLKELIITEVQDNGGFLYTLISGISGEEHADVITHSSDCSIKDTLALMFKQNGYKEDVHEAITALQNTYENGQLMASFINSRCLNKDSSDTEYPFFIKELPQQHKQYYFKNGVVRNEFGIVEHKEYTAELREIELKSTAFNFIEYQEGEQVRFMVVDFEHEGAYSNRHYLFFEAEIPEQSSIMIESAEDLQRFLSLKRQFQNSVYLMHRFNSMYRYNNTISHCRLVNLNNIETIENDENQQPTTETEALLSLCFERGILV